MTIDEMRNKLDKFCEGFDLCIDGCPLRKPDDGSCRWNNLSDKSTEDCYHFLEGLIGKPKQPEINFVKVERNDEVERITYEEVLNRIKRGEKITNEEVLNRLKIWVKECDDYLTCKAMKDAIEITIEALEKQIPKKPIEKFAFSDGIGAGLCPFCNEGVNEEMNFCSYCGQAIDWEED